MPLVITPFPGGICRSSSTVGSKYDFLNVSTNTPFCPTLRDSVLGSKVPEGITTVYEMIIDGLYRENVMEAMGRGIRAATEVEGVKKISAVNFDGRLGKHKLPLKEALEFV